MSKKHDTAAAWANAMIAALPGVLTYTELVERAGGSKLQPRPPLDLIAKLCIKCGWPQLTLMAVTAGTKNDLVPMPSAEAFDPKTDRLLVSGFPRHEIGVRQAQVRAFDWTPHLDVLTDPKVYEAIDAPAVPPEKIIGITRRVPEPMIRILDDVIAGLKAMPQPDRAAVAPKLLALLGAPAQ